MKSEMILPFRRRLDGKIMCGKIIGLDCGGLVLNDRFFVSVSLAGARSLMAT